LNSADPIARLKTELHEARHTIIHLMPLHVATRLRGYLNVTTVPGFDQWTRDTRKFLIEEVADPDPGTLRALCPLCWRGENDEVGFKVPAALERHLTGGKGMLWPCRVWREVMALAGEHLRPVLEAERAARRKVREGRRGRERQYLVERDGTPKLADEDIADPRTAPGWAFAEERLKLCGFAIETDAANVVAFRMCRDGCTVLADPRRRVGITVHVWREDGPPIETFKLPDLWKENIEGKFGTMLAKACAALAGKGHEKLPERSDNPAASGGAAK